MSPIIIDRELSLTTFSEEDQSCFVRYLNDKEIYSNTLVIPYPYQESDADAWILRNQQLNQEGKQLAWGIRKVNRLIGIISLKELYGHGAHKDEVGYWIGKPYWNQGIMTKVLKKFSSYALTSLNLTRIEAPVFSHNPASARVLEKVGYQKEGTLKKFYKKDGRFIDAIMYALVR